jgi:hypothetical protein
LTARGDLPGGAVFCGAQGTARFSREAFKALTETMGVVIENPYDPLRTLPTSDEQIRRITFGDWGMTTYVVSDGLEIVRIVHITWAG